MAECPCPEEGTVKEGSPGLLQPDEWLLLVLFDGDNWDGEIINAKIVKRLKERELSVARRAYCTAAIVRSQVVEKRIGKSPDLNFIGAAKCLCGEVRSLMASGEADRIFCAYDDPLPDFAGHALIGFSQYPKTIKDYWTKHNNRTAAAANLIIIFQKAGIPLHLDNC